MDHTPPSDDDLAGRLASLEAELEVARQENASLHALGKKLSRDLQESMGFQSATREILDVIAQAPDQLDSVLSALTESAARVCGAAEVRIFRVEGDRIRRVGRVGSNPDTQVAGISPDLPLTRGSVTGRAIVDRKTIHVADLGSEIDTEFPDAAALQKFLGHRTTLATPLLRDGEVLGAILLLRREVAPFSERQIELLEIFADQAVIAIENARLFEAEQARTKELRESLDYQTATSGVLQVISRSQSDLQPVLDSIAQTAARLCRADKAVIRRRRGEAFVAVASFGHTDEMSAYIESHPTPLGRGSMVGRVALEKRTVHIPDVAIDPEYTRADLVQVMGFRSGLAVPLLREDDLIGVVLLLRNELQPFSVREIALVETFADQAVIAIENARLLDELQSRQRELTESLEYQTATGKVLEVISRSQSAHGPVFQAICESAARLFDAPFCNIFRFDGTLLHFETSHGLTEPGVAALRRHYPCVPGRESASGRAIAVRGLVEIPNFEVDPDYEHRLLAEELGYRSVVAVPMLRGAQPVGVIVVGGREAGSFPRQQIALVETFADQAVIAIENARLLDELQTRQKELESRGKQLTESLEYQTATSVVLSVISSSPNALQPVLESIVTTAAELCQADHAHVRMLQDGRYHLAASTVAKDSAILQAERQNPISPGRDSVTGRAIAELRTVHIHDATTDPEHTYFQRVGGVTGRTILAVPIVHAGTAIGTITLFRDAVAPFSERQIAQITTFADQALIAIQNTRLFEQVQQRTLELSEALDYQTATSEVLGVISRSPNELQPVLQAITETASQLCDSEFAALFNVVGDKCIIAAGNNARTEFIQYLRDNPVPIEPGSAVGRAAYERKTFHIEDVLALPNYTRSASQKMGGQRTVLTVPLLRDGEAIGVIALMRSRVKAFTEKQINLVETFADQAVIAMNNARLFNEVQEREKELARSVEEMTSLAEVGRTVSSTLDLSRVLQAVLESACRMAYASGGTVYVYDREADAFRLEAGHNMTEEHIEQVRRQPIRMGDVVVGECGVRREAVQVEDLNRVDLARSPLLDILMRAGVRAILALPLIYQGEVIGALVVRRNYPGSFSPETVRLLEVFAGQSAIAVNNARLFKKVEETGDQLRLASQHKSQFLANMSHELRTPLNAILGYTELMQDGLYGELPEKAAGVLDRVQSNGKHLLGLINSVLDLSKIEAGQLKLDIVEYGMSGVIEAVIVATEPLAQEKKLDLESEVAGELPRGKGDERRLTQVLLNLVGNAIKFTDRGGVTIGAREVSGRFHVFVRDTGPGIPASEQERIFEEFHQMDSSNTKAKGGTGLGLAITKRIIEMHGGRIWVELKPDEGATFRFEVPVATVGAEQNDG